MPSAVAGSESLAPSEYDKQVNGDPSFVLRTVPKFVLPLAAALLLISGSYDSIISKLMNKQNVAPCEGCTPRFFEAPFFQTFSMYIGESLCLIAFYIDKWIAKKKNKQQALDFASSAKSFTKQPCPKYWWIVPTCIDFASTVMINYAFVFTQVSTAQLLRNFNVVVTAFLSVVYLRVGLRRHQILGVVVVTCGLVLTGAGALMNPDTQNNYSGKEWVGILLAIVGTFLSAFQFVFEESLFRKYYSSPLEAVGLMGVYGMIIGGILLVILEFAGVEKTSETFYMMRAGTKEGGILIASSVSFVLSVSCFNASGLMVTKLASGLLRVILIAARTLTIWILELIIQWSSFEILNFLGLVVVLGGVLLYNYNYFAPAGCCPWDRGLKRAVLCCGARNPDAILEAQDTEISDIAHKESEVV